MTKRALRSPSQQQAPSLWEGHCELRRGKNASIAEHLAEDFSVNWTLVLWINRLLVSFDSEIRQSLYRDEANFGIGTLGGIAINVSIEVCWTDYDHGGNGSNPVFRRPRRVRPPCGAFRTSQVPA
jgi:hypothetical protein